jgi:glutamine synthetase
VDRQQDFVLRTLEERDIRFVRLWFTDVLGTLKSVSVAPAELEAAFEEGIGFDGSAIEGFTRVYEADMVAMPDPSTFQVFPFEGAGSGESARMFCDIQMPDGSPSWADPRHVLRRALRKAADKGFTFYTHPEIEFFLLADHPTDGRRSTPAAISTTPRTQPRVTSGGRPCWRWSGSASRWSSATTRPRPVSRRSTCGTPTRWPPPTTS